MKTPTTEPELPTCPSWCGTRRRAPDVDIQLGVYRDEMGRRYFFHSCFVNGVCMTRGSKKRDDLLREELRRCEARYAVLRKELRASQIRGPRRSSTYARHLTGTKSAS